jgi:hypothetical protein
LLVELCTGCLRDTVVSSVADERVVEAEHLARNCHVRPQQLLTAEREQVRVDLLTLLAGRELEHGVEREATAGDSGALNERAFLLLEAVDALVENAADRSRHRVRFVLASDCRHLLDEEGIAFGCLGNAGPHRRWSTQRFEQQSRFGLGQRLELERYRRSAQPLVPPLS